MEIDKSNLLLFFELCPGPKCYVIFVLNPDEDKVSCELVLNLLQYLRTTNYKG